MKKRPLKIYEYSSLINRFIWFIPKSHANVPVISFNEKANTLINPRFLKEIKCHIDEIKSCSYSNVIIFDLNNIELENEIKLIFHFQEIYKTDYYTPIFVASDKIYTSSIENIVLMKSLIDALNYSNSENKKKRNNGGVIPIYELNNINLTPFSSPIQKCRTETFIITEDDLSAILIELEGSLLPGSKDDDDVNIIINTIYNTTFIFGNEPLIIDVTKLIYTWGDKLSLIPFEAEKDKNYPFRLVLKTEQLESFAYVIGDEKRICSTVEQAIEELKTQVEK
jgi:hypothetical protein